MNQTGRVILTVMARIRYLAMLSLVETRDVSIEQTNTLMSYSKRAVSIPKNEGCLSILNNSSALHFDGTFERRAPFDF